MTNERLQRANEYLGRDRDELRELIIDRDIEIERLSTCTTLRDQMDQLMAQVSRLGAENARLRAAHQRIISHGDYTAPEGMKRISREALGLPDEPVKA